MTTRRAILKGAAGVVAIAAPATIARAGDGPVKVRIGWSTMPGHLIPVLYKNPDRLKHYGKSYTVETISFRGSSPQIAAMAAGEIDMGAFGALVLALSVNNARIDTKAVADIIQDGVDGYHSETFMVRADSEIKTVADLKGKRIGTNAIGSASDTAMRAMLEKHDLRDKRDVTVVEASFPNIPPMIEAEKLDMGAVLQPFSDEYLRNGKFKTLFTAKDAIGPSQLVTLCANGMFLRQNREQLMDFFEDHVRSVRWFTDPNNHTEAVQIIAKFMQQPPEMLDYIFTKRDYYRDPYMVPNLQHLQGGIGLAVKLGFANKGIKVEPDHADMSFVNEAKRRIEASPS